MAAYTDYTYYSGTFLGAAISSTNFPRLALRASEVIDKVTFNRAAAVILANTDTATITAIKNAVCAVAEQYQENEANGNEGGGISSESVGSMSVTYVKGSKKTMTDDQKLERAAKNYLASTGLMFKGFEDGE
jgi:hypothetical protein